MASNINFPDNPTTGQEYTYGSVTYRYTGNVWRMVPAVFIPDEWTPPSDWIQLPTVANNEILILASDIQPFYNFKVNVTGGYTVDWGDGLIENYASGVECTHLYARGTGQVCSRGYTTWKMRIYAQIPANQITAFYVLGNSVRQYDEFGWLIAKFGTTGLNYGYGNFYNYYYGQYSPYLEYLEFPSSLLSLDILNTPLINSNSLQKVVMPQSYRVAGITFDGAFRGTPKLKKFDFNTSSIKLLSMSTAFQSSGVEEIKMPNTVSGCADWTNAFYGTRLKIINIPNIDTNCACGNMFMNTRIEEISFPSSWNGKITKSPSMFRGCAFLRKATMPTSVNISGTDQFTTDLFNGCSSLITVTLPVSNIGNVQQYMLQRIFFDCKSLKTIYNFPDASASITVDRTFYNCEQLEKVYGTDGNEYDFNKFGNTTSNFDHAETFYRCYALNPTDGLKIPNKITGRFVLNGFSSAYRAKLQRLIFTNPNPVSTWAGGSPQLDIAYCSLDATALNALFTSIVATQDPAMATGKVIRITGNPGAETCDTTILTAGGKWTVNKAT